MSSSNPFIQMIENSTLYSLLFTSLWSLIPWRKSVSSWLCFLLSYPRRKNVCLPFKTVRRFAPEVRLFLRKLNIQRSLFREECHLLLAQVAGNEEASEMLNQPAHPAWQDPKIDHCFVKLLGDMKESCMAIINMISESLQRIEKEGGRLASVVDPKTGDKAKEMSRLKQVKEKLAYSFCDQSRLDRDLAALKSSNEDFRGIGDQIFKLESLRTSPVQRTIKRQDKDIEKLRLIQKASTLLYQALGSACTKHTEHQAHFCLQPSLKEDLHPQVHFSIAFNNLTLGNTSGLGDLLWFDVDTSIKEVLNADATQVCNVLAQVSGSLKRRNLSPSPSPPPATKSRKRGKTDRFAPSTPPPGRPLLPPVIQLLQVAMEPPNLCKHGNFCNQLKDCSRQPLARQDRCIGLLEETEKYRHLVYLPQTSPVPQQTQTISLATYFSTARKQDLSDGLPLHERIGLAKLLSTAVLQFHATSWLGGRWRSEDVFSFYIDPSTRGVEEFKSFNAPYINVSVKGINGPLSRVPTFPATRSFIQNPLLFDLGVMLLELAFQVPLRQLQKPIDLENGQENMHTEFFTAKRLCRSTMQLGLRYKEVARKCIHCDFGRGDDLNKPELQEAFYREIICELDKLEGEFRRLQLGA